MDKTRITLTPNQIANLLENKDIELNGEKVSLLDMDEESLTLVSCDSGEIQRFNVGQGLL
jgi:hypothetical protein